MATGLSELVFTALEGTGEREIHIAFMEAFSDYSVKVDMPFDKFKRFLKSSGVDLSMSAGAYIGGKLCAFVLNGIREANGVKTAYDSGTGVVPEYRRLGLTKRMFSFLMPLLRDHGVKRYVLEVIKTNEPALKLYLGMGFEIKRGLKCLKAQKGTIEHTNSKSARAAKISELSAGMLPEFWDYAPTWQNTLDSVMAEPERCAAAIAEADGKTVGYGIINTASGRVYQLAVNREYRGRGLGGALLEKLAEQTSAEQITFLNVDAGCGSMTAFLQSAGFDEYVGQYEMELKMG